MENPYTFLSGVENPLRSNRVKGFNYRIFLNAQDIYVVRINVHVIRVKNRGGIEKMKQAAALLQLG